MYIVIVVIVVIRVLLILWQSLKRWHSKPTVPLGLSLGHGRLDDSNDFATQRAFLETFSHFRARLDSDLDVVCCEAT